MSKKRLTESEKKDLVIDRAIEAVHDELKRDDDPDARTDMLEHRRNTFEEILVEFMLDLDLDPDIHAEWLTECAVDELRDHFELRYTQEHINAANHYLFRAAQLLAQASLALDACQADLPDTAELLASIKAWTREAPLTLEALETLPCQQHANGESSHV